MADDINTANDSMTATLFVEQAVLDMSAAISVLPAAVIAGDPAVDTDSAVNVGNVDYTAGVPASVTSDNGTPGDLADDFLVFSTTIAGPIGPGESVELSNSVDTGAYAAGPHTLAAQLGIGDADAGERLGERNTGGADAADRNCGRCRLRPCPLLKS